MSGDGARAMQPGSANRASDFAPALRRIMRERSRPQPRPGERCEMCAAPISEEHRHVVNLEARSLVCACTACYLLFTREGAAQGRYQAVPDRYLFDPRFRMTPAQWDALQIPVGVAFLFRNSAQDRFVAFYPSPAGATESELDVADWETILSEHPALADPQPDVEALIVRKRDDGFECYLVPVDACYELVGLVRIHWKGFDGGDAVREHMDHFFDTLRARSRRGA